MSKEQQRMMEDRDKLLGETTHPLTKLFRLILRDWPTGGSDWEGGVEAKNWNMRLTRFLKSPLSRCPKNPKDIGQERNNFNRAIAKREITFKTFQKALQILGPVRYSMGVTLELRSGEVIRIETPMAKNPYAELDKLSAALTQTAMTPVHDIDIDEDEDLVQDLTTDIVDRSIDNIQVPVDPSGTTFSARKRRTFRTDSE